MSTPSASGTLSTGAVPDGPKGRALVGNLYDYERDPIGFLRRNHDAYGDVFTLTPMTISVNHPDLVREIYLRTNEDFSANAPRLTGGRNEESHEESVRSWMRVRRVGWHGMNREVTLAHGRRMLAALDRTVLGSAGAETDVVDLLRGYAGELAIDFCLGQDTGELASAVARRTAVADQIAQSSLRLPAWLPLPRVRALLRTTRHLDQTLARHVRERRADPVDEPRDLLDLLLAETVHPLADEQIVKLLKANLFASYSTPGLALAWIVYLSAQHPDEFARVRAEATALHERTGSVLDDARLPLTEAFVKEVLRLYPPVWLMQRYAVRPTTLGPWDVRPKQFVSFSPYLLHRDPRWWGASAEVFRPDRWHDGAPPPHRFAYVPFGAGPRVCLGIQLAMYQLVVATARLAVGYRIEVTSSGVTATPRPSLTPLGLTARFVPRDPSGKRGQLAWAGRY